MIIKLPEVAYDPCARDGTFCKLPYPDHPKGCPNFPKCIEEHPIDFDFNKYHWYGVVEEFDLKTHAQKMKEKHPDWTDRQCRNLLYWQNGVRHRLKEKAFEALDELSPDKGGLILDIPEAHGVDVYATMANVGIMINPHHPDIVKKVMLVGIERHE